MKFVHLVHLNGQTTQVPEPSVAKYIAQGYSLAPDRKKVLQQNSETLEPETVVVTVKNEIPLTGSLSINKATLAELVRLPSIGTAKAKSIVTERDKSGYFEGFEDLRKRLPLIPWTDLMTLINCEKPEEKNISEEVTEEEILEEEGEES